MLPLIQGAAETRKLKRKDLKNWLVSSLLNLFFISLCRALLMIFNIVKFLLIHLLMIIQDCVHADILELCTNLQTHHTVFLHSSTKSILIIFVHQVLRHLWL